MPNPMDTRARWRLVVRAGTTWLLVVCAVAQVVAALQGQEPALPRDATHNPHAVRAKPPTEQPDSSPAFVAVQLRVMLLDARRYQEAQHDRKQAAAEPVNNAEIALPNLAVKVHVSSRAGQLETMAAATDAAGVLALDLGERATTSEISIEANTRDATYLGMPLKVAAALPGTVYMFRVSDNPAALTQQIQQVATVRDDGKLQVRQIVMLQNLSWEVYQAKPGRVAYSFPVPAGATITSLTVDDDELPNPASRLDAFWGQGVPIDRPIYPVKSYRLMGVYELAPQSESAVHLDLEFPLEFRGREEGQAGYMLMVEKGKVHYLPPTGRNQVALQDGGDLDPAQFPKPLHSYGLSTLPAHVKLPITLRIGAPPVHSRTKFVTALILLVLGGAVVAGLLLARGRHRPAALEDRVLRGELNIAEYQRLSAGESAAGPSSLDSDASMSEHVLRLDAIVARYQNGQVDGDAMQQDVRTLAELLRDYLRNRERTQAG